MVPRARAAKDKVRATEAEGRAAVCQRSLTTPSVTKRSGASTSEPGKAVQARFGQRQREQCKSVRKHSFSAWANANIALGAARQKRDHRSVSVSNLVHVPRRQQHSTLCESVGDMRAEPGATRCTHEKIRHPKSRPSIRVGYTYERICTWFHLR